MQWPLAQAAHDHGDRIALIDAVHTLSFDAYCAATEALAHELRQDDIGEGRYVALLADPSVISVVAIMAVIRAGAVACPLNTRSTPEQIRSMLSVLPNAICMADEKHRDLIPDDIEVRPISSSISDVITEDFVQPTMLATQSATVVFTSGSAATPKAVAHTLAAHLYSASGSNGNITLSPGDRWLVALPLYHVGGLAILFRTMLAGATAVLIDSGDDLAAALDGFEITHCSLVPTQLHRLLETELPDSVVRRLKAVLIGGAARSAGLIRQANDRGLPLYTSYGLTEMASQVTTTGPQAAYDELLTSGYPLALTRLQIAPDGEILVGGRSLMSGYVVGDNVTLPVDENGWLHTGDIGRLDDHGRLVVTGRKDNMFTCAGENIYPEAIEQAMLELDGIEEVVVVGVEDKEYGARPVAFVRPSGDLPEAADLAELLRSRLTGLQLPVAVLEWPEEDTNRLKPDRAAMTRLAATLYASLKS